MTETAMLVELVPVVRSYDQCCSVGEIVSNHEPHEVRKELIDMGDPLVVERLCEFQIVSREVGNESVSVYVAALLRTEEPRDILGGAVRVMDVHEMKIEKDLSCVPSTDRLLRSLDEVSTITSGPPVRETGDQNVLLETLVKP